VVNVDGMVKGLTPQQFDEWLAYRQIVPDPMDRLIEVCKRGFTLLANAWGGKIEPDDLDPMEHEKPVASGKQIKAMLNSTLGRHGNSNR
jgi:hypothetical protein